MIHVIAIITAVSGKRSEVIDAFLKVIPLVHAEEGCIEYVPVTDVEKAGAMQTALGPDTYMVIEKWESMDALNAHAASSHMTEYGKQVGHLIDNRVIHILN
ncbi:MAG: putative quinol monooxygenase [Granulosicoccus sp.]